MSFVPVSIESQIKWIQRLASVPLLGGLVMLALTAWPLAIYVNVAEALLHTSQLPPLHNIIGGCLAGAWSLVVWFPLRTHFRILWVPAPIFYPALSVLISFIH